MIKKFEKFTSEEKVGKDYMAQGNISTIKQSSQYLDELINRNTEDLPDWVEDKLSRCAQDMQDLHDYFKSLKTNESSENDYKFNSFNNSFVRLGNLLPLFPLLLCLGINPM